MKCEKCGEDFLEKSIEKHHVHPRFMDNKKGNGSKINLCKKCHMILHLIIPSIIWKNIKKEDREKVIKQVKDFSMRYVSKIRNTKDKKLEEFIPKETIRKLTKEKDILRFCIEKSFLIDEKLLKYLIEKKLEDAKNILLKFNSKTRKKILIFDNLKWIIKNTFYRKEKNILKLLI